MLTQESNQAAKINQEIQVEIVSDQEEHDEHDDDDNFLNNCKSTANAETEMEFEMTDGEEEENDGIAESIEAAILLVHVDQNDHDTSNNIVESKTNDDKNGENDDILSHWDLMVMTNDSHENDDDDDTNQIQANQESHINM